jgi:hypothetical protein
LVECSDEMVYSRSLNLKAVPKVAMMKASVVLIVLQGLIEDFLFSANKLGDGNPAYTPQANGYRNYCKLLFCVCLSLQ